MTTATQMQKRYQSSISALPPALGIISALRPRNLARAAASWEKTTHVSPHPHSLIQSHSGNPSAY